MVHHPLKEVEQEDSQKHTKLSEELPAGGATFCAGAGGAGGAGAEGFGAGADGFFSSGGDTLGIQDAKVTTNKQHGQPRLKKDVSDMCLLNNLTNKQKQ